jgi:hypothetical protein
LKNQNKKMTTAATKPRVAKSRFILLPPLPRASGS